MILLLGRFVVTFGEADLIALDNHLAFEEVDFFACLRREFFGQLRRLRVTDVGGEFAASLIIGHLASGYFKCALGFLKPFTELSDADLELDQSLPQAGSLFSGIRARGKEAVELELQVVEIHSVDWQEEGSGMVPAGTRDGQATTRLDWTVSDMLRFAVPVRPLPSRLLLLAALAGCGKSDGPSATCGISSLTAPLVVLESFGKGNLLDQVPPDFPTSTVVRFVAGPAVKGSIQPDSSGKLRVTVSSRPEGAKAGYAVLVTDGRFRVQGVLIYEGAPVPGATTLGSVVFPDGAIPLLGVRLDPRTIADPRCPLFPDSLK